ncbi:hypothetical protein JCGZ_04713 [Jatropha curcas]|uniref:Bet v I/Major latex protein domain-containing protein n=1 Tax=Jatropha curcas TaxID=180498 RepID=A0A067L1U5_JATCU|nr:MLP-like protein 328 [Jatropha curcas]XP_012072240.1 MLP-like protein 328 [Jatropha curcas]KDP20178.1 hypothetical protein JCGZ_00008 [Jatropha curcas]KDP38069.1 hypothetical protein JCGZ_04712 [Jatropha curcas]KDP38070.1 hypothetical protein JCGZ_04713 [Jatropha curcas]
MADDLKGQLEAEVQLKCSPEQFFSVWKNDAQQVPNHTPSNVQGVKLHEGDWETSGCIKIWDYTIEGKPGVFKEKVELDEANKIVKLIGLEGDVFEIYKVYNCIWHLKGNLAKVTIEYEKLNDNVPAPHIYLDFLVSMTKDIDASLVKP